MVQHARQPRHQPLGRELGRMHARQHLGRVHQVRDDAIVTEPSPVFPGQLTELMTDGSMTLRVVDLPTLISIKASTGRARDRRVVPLLQALLEERSDAE
ncbi:MAG: hypothetical protein AAGF11_38280 [Myxococcota bacterium]